LFAAALMDVTPAVDLQEKYMEYNTTLFCPQSDVRKSFQLHFPSRTVDLTANSEGEALLLVRGFSELRDRMQQNLSLFPENKKH
jgi:hypothetical protein